MSKNRRPLPLLLRRRTSFDESLSRVSQSEEEYSGQNEKVYQDGQKENRRNRRMRNRSYKRDPYSD